MKRSTLFALLLLSAVACGPAEPEDFDRSCQVDDDCIVAYLTRDCECEEVTAVNKKERSKVDAANSDEDRWQWCPGGEVACDIAPMEAYCDTGLCKRRLKMANNSSNNIMPLN